MQTKIEGDRPPATVFITSVSPLAPCSGRRLVRRLPDRILVAAHEACDLGDLEIAARLLSTLETFIRFYGDWSDTERRCAMKSMIAAHYRLWQLQHDDHPAIEPSKPATGFMRIRPRGTHDPQTS